MPKSKMAEAQAAKKDEFYTQLSDIANELRHYKEQFRDKVVFCNCDDPYESNFFKFFALNFNEWGLKKLIATCYKGSPIQGDEITLFDVDALEPPATVARAPYKIEINVVPDANDDGSIDLTDVAYLVKHEKNVLTLLDGDGDFRSDECIDLLKQSDIVATNPPFSLFREYIAQLYKYEKKFVIIGHQNAISYKEVFPLIQSNKVWLGYGFAGNVAFFESPYDDIATSTDKRQGMIRVSGVQWFTNIDIPKRHERFDLFQRYNNVDYPTYDNYDAIDVSRTVDIPLDYDGVMGVPITFLNKYNPEQFEIVGIAKAPFGGQSRIYPRQIQIDKSGRESLVTKLNDGPAIAVKTPPHGQTYYKVGDQLLIQKYARILIKRIG